MKTTKKTAGTQRLRRRRFGPRRQPAERGAALVEFALIVTPLLLILFGTIEFGWAFFQLNDVRHGAREGLRLSVVASDVTPATAGWTTAGQRLAQATCERMDRRQGVEIGITIADLDSPTNGFDVGDDLTITAEKPLDQLTMMFDPVLKSVVLEEVVTSRLEQDPPSGVHGTKWTCL